MKLFYVYISLYSSFSSRFLYISCLLTFHLNHSFSLKKMKHAPRIMDTIIESFPVPWLPLPTTQSALSDMVYISQNSSRFDQDWKYSRFMPWRFYYLDYFHLQQIIKQDADKITINRKLEDEWKKVKKKKKKGTTQRKSHQIRPCFFVWLTYRVTRYMISICSKGEK